MAAILDFQDGHQLKLIGFYLATNISVSILVKMLALQG
jgi:hypothetical protein